MRTIFIANRANPTNRPTKTYPVSEHQLREMLCPGDTSKQCDNITKYAQAAIAAMLLDYGKTPVIDATELPFWQNFAQFHDAQIEHLGG